jgi:hypothetical protein
MRAGARCVTRARALQRAALRWQRGQRSGGSPVPEVGLVDPLSPALAHQHQARLLVQLKQRRGAEEELLGHGVARAGRPLRRGHRRVQRAAAAAARARRSVRAELHVHAREGERRWREMRLRAAGRHGRARNVEAQRGLQVGRSGQRLGDLPVRTGRQRVQLTNTERRSPTSAHTAGWMMMPRSARRSLICCAVSLLSCVYVFREAHNQTRPAPLAALTRRRTCVCKSRTTAASWASVSCDSARED